MFHPFTKNILVRILLPVVFLFLFSGCAALKLNYFDRFESVNLTTFNNLIFVNITVNGKSGIFMVDTGASKSLLDINRADEYGYKYELYSKMKYFGIGGTQEVYSVYDYSVKEFYIYLLATDLSEITPYLKRNHIDIIGIVGSDFLNSRRAYVDYENLKLYYLN